MGLLELLQAFYQRLLIFLSPSTPNPILIIDSISILTLVPSREWGLGMGRVTGKEENCLNLTHLLLKFPDVTANLFLF